MLGLRVMTFQATCSVRLRSSGNTHSIMYVPRYSAGV